MSDTKFDLDAFHARIDAATAKIAPQLKVASVKVLKELSDETLCFSATFSYAGRSYGQVRNAGHGGCHEYFTQEANELAAQLAKEFNESEILDIAITDAVVEVMAEREIKKFVAAQRRRLKKCPNVAGFLVISSPDALECLPYKAGESQEDVLKRCKDVDANGAVTDYPIERS